MSAPNNDQRADLLRRWVDALRSGKYKQARGRLKTDDGYCCLGVLCDVSGSGTWARPKYDKRRSAAHYYVTGDTTRFCALPPSVADVVKLSANTDGSDEEFEYVRMNDAGATFAEIADAIEKNHPDVFGAPTHA